MDALRLERALVKAGATIERFANSRAVIARANGKHVMWYVQENFDGTKSAVSVHTSSPYTDSQSDCFCDTFYRTIKRAAEYLKG